MCRRPRRSLGRPPPLTGMPLGVPPGLDGSSQRVNRRRRSNAEDVRTLTERRWVRDQSD
jgi:hypothetical protein